MFLPCAQSGSQLPCYTCMYNIQFCCGKTNNIYQKQNASKKQKSCKTEGIGRCESNAVDGLNYGQVQLVNSTRFLLEGS